MLDPAVFARVPLASADSTNVARNMGLDVRWNGPYVPRSLDARALVLADRIETQPAARRWSGECLPNLPLFATETGTGDIASAPHTAFQPQAA
jgi:hypothetical protein